MQSNYLKKENNLHDLVEIIKQGTSGNLRKWNRTNKLLTDSGQVHLVQPS